MCYAIAELPSVSLPSFLSSPPALYSADQNKHPSVSLLVIPSEEFHLSRTLCRALARLNLALCSWINIHLLRLFVALLQAVTCM